MTKKTTKKSFFQHLGPFFQHLGQGIGVLFSNALIFLPILAVIAFIDSKILHGALAIQGVDPSQSILSGTDPAAQSKLISLALTHMGLMLTSKALIGPALSILVVIYARATILKQELSVGKAFNFLLKRYTKVFVPYLLAMLSIQIGSIILIPGIFFMMQFAFVDSVATLEQEKHVLSRSTRLTRTRRHTLVLLIVPYLLLGQFIQLGEFAYSSNLGALMLINMAYEGLLVLLLSTFYSLYHERIALIAEKKARKAARKAEQEQAEENEDLEDTVLESTLVDDDSAQENA